jgi:hypothetical protein
MWYLQTSQLGVGNSSRHFPFWKGESCGLNDQVTEIGGVSKVEHTLPRVFRGFFSTAAHINERRLIEYRKKKLWLKARLGKPEIGSKEGNLI